MKKVFSLSLLLIFFLFSCTGTPKKKDADDVGLSQLELTADKDEFESQSEQDMLAIADDSEIEENPETEADDFTADAEFEEQQIIVEAVEEAPEESIVPAPVVTAVQPPPVLPVVTEAVPPVTDTPPAEQSVQEQPAQGQAAEELADAAEGESEDEPVIVPPRSQPWLTPPPAVSAVKDDAPVPNRQGLLVPQSDEIIFSRTIRATVGQTVEIPFRGTGWVYLGEIASRRGLAYNSRRLDPEGQSFIFKAEEAGTYALKFYRQDFIRDYILNDYVQVIVGESSAGGGAGWFKPPIDQGRVTAEPRWPSALDEAAMLRGSQGGAKPATAAETVSERGSAPPAPASTVRETAAVAPPAPSSVAVIPLPVSPSVPPAATTPTATPIPPTEAPQAALLAAPMAAAPEIPQPETIMEQEKLPPEEMLKKAQENFDEGNTAAAIALLDKFMEYYPDGSDELYWLYGQFYEANTPSRNIMLSLDYYRRLINEYPQSRRYNDARRRIAYLERFYINIQ